MTKDEALKLAREGVEIHSPNMPEYKVCAALIEALAQPEREPVAYGMWDTMLGKGNRMMMVRLDKGQDGCTVPLYTTPPEQGPVIGTKTWFEDGKMVTQHLTAKDIYKEPEPVIDKSAAIRIATSLGWEPKRTWVGLTEDEFRQIMLDTYNIDLNVPGHSSDDHLLWRAIEAKLRSKNACEENATDPSKEDWDSACNNLAEARTIPNPEFDKAHTQHKPNTA